VPLKRSLTVLPAGIVMGASVMLMAFYSKDLFPPDWVVRIGRFHEPIYMLIAYAFLTFIGALSGFFVVPMNALLQHRGHLLLSAGHSIAVQNFNENLSILVMLCLYTLLVRLDVPVSFVIVLFSLFVMISMALIMRLHRHNQRQGDALSLLGDEFR
jgi:MFS transporter, LPLT family, lysophospholipid transporter